MMDLAGIDAAWLTSAQGMCADLETSRLVNDKAKKAEKDYPGRFIAAAHANPLGGPDALKELNRCKHELGCQGVVITSEHDGKFLDNPAYEPFWTEAARLGMFVFVHPALKLNYSQQFDGFDTARSVGREFSLIMATIRLINSGVFDRHPNLTVHMAHLSGGIASMLGRIRCFQDRDFWGTKGNAAPRRESEAGFRPLHPQQSDLRHRGLRGRDLVGEDRLVEIPADRIVFATDYPQEIRAREIVRDFVRDIRALGKDGEAILSGNVGKLLKPQVARNGYQFTPPGASRSRAPAS